MVLGCGKTKRLGREDGFLPRWWLWQAAEHTLPTHRFRLPPPSFRLRFISAVSSLCSRLTALSKFLFSWTTGCFFEVSRQSYCISRIQEWLLDSRICSLSVSRAWPMNHIWFTACVCKLSFIGTQMGLCTYSLQLRYGNKGRVESRHVWVRTRMLSPSVVSDSLRPYGP